MSSDITTYRYSMKIAYKGKNYSGSQIQPGQVRTIQSELEKALCTLIYGVDINPTSNKKTKRKIKTVFSGRTDAGVSAKGQVVHFEINTPIVASKAINSINGILPNDISVSELKLVNSDFHAQKSARKRTYQYVFLNRTQRDAFDDELLLIRYPVDIMRMQKSLEYILGEHDFTSFKSSGTKNPSKTCLIYKVECKKLDDTVVITIVGNRFLYNMVRTIVGTLLFIEKENLPPEHMKKVLEAKDRKKAGKTVSPYGLTLMKVEY